MRKIVAVVLAVVSVAGAGAVRAAPKTNLVGVLKPGIGVFWDGGRVGAGPDRVPLATQECPTAPCFTYTLKVAAGGKRLRVAIDVPQRNDMYRIGLRSPSGTVTEKQNFNAFNAEAFVTDPEPGTWTVTVSPLTAEYSSFDLRAKLEGAIYSPPRARKLWLPNLQVPRLWEFGFVAPVTGLAGMSFDDANPPVDAAGIHPFSCTGDEMQAGAQRCLRFSFQMTSAGDGYFDVRFDTSGTNRLAGKMVQCIQRPGRAPVAHDAGEFDYHAAHGHYHYKDVIEHLLFRVTDRKAERMVLAGKGEKTGYHPADQSFAQWDRFVQAPSGTSGADGNCYAGSTDRIGLSMGWGDAYRWQRPGNFVEFGANGDGWYVVRTTADPLDHVLETNERDNSGYAYLRIVGDQVRLLEHGIGKSPWDPHKVVNRF